MSYQVIARKWRPNLFEEVVGQDHVVRTLRNAVSSGRIGHAYLFSGPRGVGKTTVARILSKCLNCKDGPTAIPCNQCEMCRAITGGSCVDVLEIDGASNTGVDNIRELRESVRYAPGQGRYKIYIIDEVHMLTDHAFNALLKTLEEPPPHVVFIFATTEPHKVPLTIHSRCQRFDFKRIPLKKILSHLVEIAEKEGIKIEEEALYLITRESEGSLRDAQSLLEQVISFSGTEVKKENAIDALGLMDRTVIYELTEAMLKKDAGWCLNIVENIHNFGYDLKRVTSELLECVRDIAVIKVSGKSDLVSLPEAEIGRLKTLSEGVSLERLEMLFGILTRGYEEVIRSSTPRFSFEMALLRASNPEDAKPAPPGSKDIYKRAEEEKKGLRMDAPVSASIGEKKAENPTPDAPSKDVLSKDVPSKDAPLKKDVPGFLSCIKEKDNRIYKSLESATVSLDGASVIIVADDKNTNFLQHVKKEALENICREYFGSNVRMDIRGAKGKKDVSAKAPSGDPLTKQALATLGGKVIEERRKT